MKFFAVWKFEGGSNYYIHVSSINFIVGTFIKVESLEPVGVAAFRSLERKSKCRKVVDRVDK